MRNYYTDKEQKELLKSLVVLIDTREQANGHILEYLDKKKIKHKNKKLDYGDYSFFLPPNQELGIIKPLYFDDEIVIERKGSLTELSGNLTKDRERFEKELIRKQEAKFYLMIENGSWEMIDQQKYRTEYRPASFKATLLSYMARYDINIIFRHKDCAGEFIHATFHYHLREVLKRYSNSLIEK
jgi:ERCC4-type nuclease